MLHIFHSPTELRYNSTDGNETKCRVAFKFPYDELLATSYAAVPSPTEI